MPYNVLPIDPPPSQTQGHPTPRYEPSWTLGPQHHGYVHSAASYLAEVPGGDEWEKLLASYIMFESLSAARPVSPCIKTPLSFTNDVITECV